MPAPSPLALGFLREDWPLLAVALHVSISALASAHVLLNKRSTRAAVGWFALVWLSPVLGSLLYVLMGVNRVQRKALRLRGAPQARLCAPDPGEGPPPRGSLSLRRFMDSVVAEPMSSGNLVAPLDGGDTIYEAMLAAIEGARRSVALQSYIFERDALGARFIEALAGAVARGVEVRVLVDGVGSLYSWPPVTRALAARGVPCARFLWSARPGTMAFINLRNHRKLLVVDGQLGFTGGANLREGFSARHVGAHASRDLHFAVQGPCVLELLQVFAADWAFTTGERLTGPAWWPGPLAPAGPMGVRVVPDGPDEDEGRAALAFLAAPTCARRRVRLVTAYFLPEDGLVDAMGAAARRGVQVQVLVPHPSNLPYVSWAMFADVEPLLRHGVEVWLMPPPFDHSKFMIMDEDVSFVGSPNWDARSLRLNFELLLVVHGEALNRALNEAFEARLARSRRLTLAELEARPLWRRLRDGAFRLGKPYL